MSQDGVRKYRDKRDWVEYNERLVRRDLSFLENWDEELHRLDKNR